MPRKNAFHGLLARAAESYKRALIGHQPGLVWDYVVLTAANEHQAAGYRHEISLRSNPEGPLGPFFPPSQRTLVVPDPEGFRAGSGGATLGVLRAIARDQKARGSKRKLFESLRILVIHSGGASQRLPLYSPLGKIFTPLPLLRPDGQVMTLLDHLYLLMAALPANLGPGMLVAAGDVFLLFDGATIRTPPPGVTALAIRTPARDALNHGIFRTESAEPFGLVSATLQKPTVPQMRAAGFTDDRHKVLIDSGLFFFDPVTTAALHQLSLLYNPAWQRQHRRQIDLYTDIAPAALAAHREPAGEDAVTRRLHGDLRAALRGHPLRCFELEGAAFLHIGTTLQFREALTGRNPAPACELFRQNVRFTSASPVPTSARIYQCAITTRKARIGRGVILENCQIDTPIRIGNGAIVSGLSIRRQGGPTVIPPQMLVYGVLVRIGGKIRTVTVVLGVHDDPKSDRTLCNRPLATWLTQAGLTAEDLWKRSEPQRVLWTARLFSVQPDLSRAMWIANPASVTPEIRREWRRARRFSLADILELADPAAMANHRDALSGTLQAMQWIAAVKAGSAATVQNTINHFGPRGYERLLTELDAAARDPALDELHRARLTWNIAEIQARPLMSRGIRVPTTTAVLQSQAFVHLREAMAAAPQQIAAHARIGIREVIQAAAPVRLDFAGGWTDTPPYCLENGGAVLNVAINLNDVAPIQSTFRSLDEPVIRLVSRDLGRMVVIDDPEKLRAPSDPADPFALHRAALRLTGLSPAGNESTFKKYLARLNPGGRGGFELATASNLPKGSGMGTSSILGATMLAVLRTAAGQDASHAALFEQTLLLEQHLGTGGGWQDQVGGIVGGAKITTTAPGIPQRLRVQRIGISPARSRGLEERLVVYFTGQQRLARDILRQVMGRYLSREPGAIVAFEELKANARACREALARGDFLAVAAEINHYWRLKKDLFPGSTTAAAEALFQELRPYYLASCLAGAGGGGFAFFLCRDPDQALRLRKELARIAMRPGSLGLTFHAGINHAGLEVRRRLMGDQLP